MKAFQVGNYPLIVIVGPTGAGKSDLGIYLAKAFGGEIVSCDAYQVYKGLDIGTAKTPTEDRQEIPHHMVDVVSPGEHFSAGDYMRLGRQALSEIARRSKLPIVAGGTGLYLRALLEGLFEEPAKSSQIRERIQQIADRKGLPYLYALLQKVDSLTTATLKTHDRARIIRALEIYFTSGKPRSEHFKSPLPKLTDFRVLKIGLNPPRAFLHEHLNKRVEAMCQRGLVQEVRTLLEFGYPKHAKAFDAIGYRYVMAYLQGTLSWEETRELTKTDTRQYAKRQMTWFKKENGVLWYEGFGWEDPIRTSVTDQVRIHLKFSG